MVGQSNTNKFLYKYLGERGFWHRQMMLEVDLQLDRHHVAQCIFCDSYIERIVDYRYPPCRGVILTISIMIRVFDLRCSNGLIWLRFKLLGPGAVDSLSPKPP